MTFLLPFFMVFCSFLPADTPITEHSSPDPRAVLLQRSSQDLISSLKEAMLHGCHPNKRLVYGLFFNQQPAQNKSIMVSAQPNTLEHESPYVTGFLKTMAIKQAFRASTHEVFFPYALSPPENNVLLATLNFADSDIFGFYKTGLLAQDELQVLEFPELALMREHLKLTKPHLLNANNTSLMIHNVQRFCFFDSQKYINGKTLYGNNFQNATPEQIMQAMTVLQKPQVATILPVLAPNVSLHYIYTLEKIDFFLKNLIVGFAHARHFAHTIGRSRLMLHSGGIGTGAFGNHKIVSIFLQLIAAQCVAGMGDEIADPNDFRITFFHTPPQQLAAAQTLFEEFKNNITTYSSHSTRNATEIILQLLAKYNLSPHAGTGE